MAGHQPLAPGRDEHGAPPLHLLEHPLARLHRCDCLQIGPDRDILWLPRIFNPIATDSGRYEHPEQQRQRGPVWGYDANAPGTEKRAGRSLDRQASR